MLGCELPLPVMIGEARAEVLARLWGALAQKPVPGLTGRRQCGGELAVRLAGDTEVRGPAADALPFARPSPGLALHCGTIRYADPAALIRALPLGPHAGRLADELDDSVANLALARAAAPVPDGGPAYLCRPVDLADLEQCVVGGHPVHPLCRTRLGMSP